MNVLQRITRSSTALVSRVNTQQPLKQLVKPSRSSYSSSSSSSSSYNKSNSHNNSKRSYGKCLATLVALPAFISTGPEFTSDLDDKENDCRPPLRCSSQAIQGPLRSSTGFLTPIAEPQDTRLCIGVSMIPHPAKRAKGGEDAYFISDDMKSLGVADGVGGWGDIGVDPALYARMLMASAKYFADSTPASLRDPVQIMSDAYEHSMDVQGSATCCMVTIDGYSLKTANLGDSGFMVVRNNTIIFRSKEQQHSFNFPYQLGTGSADMPYHAVNITLNIQPGDIVIVGSDGLFDNLFDDEILETVAQATEPMTIAQLIARSAHMSACSKTLISPFAKAARENGYPLATGGKLDDITVLVAKIVLTRDGNINFAM